MNEISIKLNPHQLSLFKATREEYAKQAREIANIKQAMKDDIDGLVDNLGWDKKIKKQEIKALRKSLIMFVKQSMAEEEAIVTEAATLARV